MTSYLISPAEPALIRSIGRTAALAESLGCDVVWAEPQVGGLIGVQRKTVSDFLASVGDGRLALEFSKMKDRVALPMLIVEGRPRWSTDNRLTFPTSFTAVTRKAWRSMLRAVQREGVIVEFSDDVADTVTLLEEIASWASKPHHGLLQRRPKPARGAWGDVTDEGWKLHVLQSFEGIGPTQAKAILDHFGGELPIAWTVGEEELKKVKRLGPKKVAALLRGLKAKEVAEVTA